MHCLEKLTLLYSQERGAAGDIQASVTKENTGLCRSRKKRCLKMEQSKNKAYQHPHRRTKQEEKMDMMNKRQAVAGQ